MTTLFTKLEFQEASSNKILPLQCEACKNTFYIQKRHIAYELTSSRGHLKYCSIKCFGNSNTCKLEINCTNCGEIFKKSPGQLKRSCNHFCSQSCAATFNNKNKKSGNRKSKLEHWLEKQLSALYPDVTILFNSKEAIGSELDIYIPSLNVAFEINGIFHYEPIYGIDKLSAIKRNDFSKSKACHDAKIDLCIIDASREKHFKEKSSQKYLDIITTIIANRLN